MNIIQINMKKYAIKFLSAIFIILLINLTVLNQNAVSADAKTFLWKVESKTTTVYVLGSIHFMKKESYPLSRKIEDAFNKIIRPGGGSRCQ